MSKGLENRGLQDTQTLIKSYLRHIIQQGDWVIDATAGKGRDTLFLAQCVGSQGQVIAFDIQEEAVKATQALLTLNHMEDRVQIWHKSHSTLSDYIERKVKAVVFNLGYLPGRSNGIVTEARTTIMAVQQALRVLEDQGVVVLTVYRGHPGGLDESQALTNFLTTLPKKDFSVIQGTYLNQGDLSPYWIMIQNNGRKTDENPPAEKDSRVNYE